MMTACRRCVPLALLFVGLASWAAFALPGFSDRNIAAGNLNPTDTIMVQEIRVTRSAGETVVLSAITLRNIGTADSGEIDKITIRDGGDIIGETENLAGIRGTNGVTIPLGFEMTTTTHSIKVFVTVGTSVSGGETIQMRSLFDYARNDDPGTSSWISDLSTETIRNGGFDDISDASPDAGFFNPRDGNVTPVPVQNATFNDIDANGSEVEWQAGPSPIARVENLGSAVADDIAGITLKLTINGVDYVSNAKGLDGNRTVDFFRADFPLWPGVDPDVVDNSGVNAEVSVEIENKNLVTDGHTIRTTTTLFVAEEGEGDDGARQEYEQSATSQTTQTIRKQGFERIEDESEPLASGTAATGDVVVQTVRVHDEDTNADAVQIRRIYIRNTGTATGDEITQIQVKAGATNLLTLPNDLYDLDAFRTGAWYDLTPVQTPAAQTYDVLDNEDQILKFYYTIGTPDDGHTFRPAVRVEGREPHDSGDADDDYPSDEVVYPDTLGLYEPGFEFVENETPPTGGTCYSGQRILAQRIRVEDRDEDGDDVTIDPVLVYNAGTASGNPDITKIEIWRQDTIDGEETKIGEETDLADIRTSGVRVDITNDSIVQDDPAGAVAYLLVYLQIAEPEEAQAGRTIQLETRVIHTEKNGTYDKDADSNQWIIEINHRPVPDFTFEGAETAEASIGPKADFTYEDTIQFNGTATDPDGDDIVDWHWDFGDGTTSDEQNPTHQYPNGGTFDVTLTVTDERGVTGSVTKTIEVEGPPNEPPTIDAINADPENPGVDQDVDFSVDVTDPDQPEGTAFTYEWDFGDETTSTTAAPTHSFDEGGTYTVTVTVTDAQGDSDTASIDIAVGNDPPTLTGVVADATEGNTGDPITFTAQGYDDPDDDPVGAYRWDFGDDQTTETTGPTVSHTYNAPGAYTVTVRATDDRGAVSAAQTVDVTVAGPARVVTYAYPNPASTAATIVYLLPEGATDPVLRIYDLLGRLMVEEDLGAGGANYVWNLQSGNGADMANGLYFAVVTATDAAGDTIRSEVFRLLIER